jgi:hypothetical protein
MNGGQTRWSESCYDLQDLDAGDEVVYVRGWGVRRTVRIGVRVALDFWSVEWKPWVEFSTVNGYAHRPWTRLL